MGSGREEAAGLIARFLDSLKQRHYSPRTLEGNRHLLGIFSEYLDRQLGKEIRAVTPADLEGFMRYLAMSYAPYHRDHLSTSTLASVVSLLRHFFRYLEKTREMLFNPAATLPRLHVENLPRVVLTEDEVELLLSAPNVAEPAELRDRAIFEVLYSTSLRSSELVRLNLLDVDLREGIVRVNEGKGRKDRLVPLGRVALFYLNRYLEEVRPAFTKRRNPPALFVSVWGYRIRRLALNERLEVYRERCGLSKHVTCHVLRHTCATHLLENGADIHVIQRLLGHAHVSTTEVYLRSATADLPAVHRASHPRKRLTSHGIMGGETDEKEPLLEVPLFHAKKRRKPCLEAGSGDFSTPPT